MANRKTPKLTPEKRAERAAVRKSLAVLKRRGLLSKQFDVRNATASKRNKRLIAEYGHVLAGSDRAYKVKPKVAKALKSQGEKVRNNRVVLRKDLKPTRSGDIVSTMSGGRLFTAKGHTLREAVDEAFQRSKGKPVAFSTYGNESYSVFYSAAAMYLKLDRYFDGIGLDEDLSEDGDEYEAKGGKKFKLKFFVPKEGAEEYQNLRIKRYDATAAAAQERRRAYDRRRSAAYREKKKQEKLAKLGLRKSRAKPRP